MRTPIGYTRKSFFRLDDNVAQAAAAAAASAAEEAKAAAAKASKVPCAFGRDHAYKDRLYCGRNLGRAKIPYFDGCCGVSNGPQCQDCQSAQQRGEGASKNDDGAPMAWGRDASHKFNLYCGRFLGNNTGHQPFDRYTDGGCGPSNGAPCGSCYRALKTLGRDPA